MKKSWKWKLIGMLTAVFSICLFCGCAKEDTLDDKKDKYETTAEVTYNTNGIATIGESGLAEKTFYYAENALPLELKHEDELGGVSNARYVSLKYDVDKYALLGWYEPVKGEDGQVQMENGNVKLKDEAFDFTQHRLQNGDKLNLYAKWEKKELLIVKLLCEEDAVLYSDKDETKSYTNGDVLGEYTFKGGKARDYISEILSVKDNAYTFIEFYKSTDVTNPENMLLEPKDKNDKTNWPIEKTAGQDTVIYAHFIKGDYTVIKKADNVSTFFLNAKNEKNYYLLCDVDCTGKTVNSLSTLKAKLYGNGHTISNLKVTNQGVVKDSALFGNVEESALLKDVTFENIEVEYKLGANKDKMDIYWLFTACATPSSFENVTFANATMKIVKNALNKSQKITNLYDANNAVITTRYLYGGLENDAEFTADGITYTIPVVVTVDGTNIFEE